MQNEENLKFLIAEQVTNNLQELNQMREASILTDVTLIVENRCFDCHRVVLAASCSYFKAMFLSGLRECHQTQVRLHGVSSDVMNAILHYVYTGVCILSKSNASLILQAADLIGLLVLRDSAAQYLHKNIDVTNCLQVTSSTNISHVIIF